MPLRNTAVHHKGLLANPYFDKIPKPDPNELRSGKTGRFDVITVIQIREQLGEPPVGLPPKLKPR